MPRTRDMVRVCHPGVEGVAVVPRSALRQMAPGWRIVDEDDAPPAEESKPELTPATPATTRRRKKEK